MDFLSLIFWENHFSQRKKLYKNSLLLNVFVNKSVRFYYGGNPFFKQKKAAGGLEKAAEEAPNPIPPSKYKRSFFP